MARTKALSPTEVKSIARGYTQSALSTLAGIMSSEDAGAASRVAAAQALLDRGWGKPGQPMTNENGDGPAEVIFRTVYEQSGN
jgi:hypothetical protein